MKIVRSSKIHFSKWLTKNKQDKINLFINEYSKIINYFISKYENQISEKKKYDFLNKLNVSICQEEVKTWLSYRAITEAFAEGYGMIIGAKELAKNTGKQYVSPRSFGKKICISQRINIQTENKNTKTFDFNVSLGSIGNKIKISIPLKKHKQFNKWDEIGNRSRTITLTKNYIQFSFEIETGEKKKQGKEIGIDIGMNKLVATSDNKFYGEEISELLKELSLKKQGSKAYYRKKEEIKETINYYLKQIPYNDLSLVVVERLKNVKHKMKLKRRLSKNIRRVVSNWSYRQVLGRIQALCEENRVSFRSVLPFYTSQECSVCGHRDKRNRLSQEEFVCQKCGHSDNADTNASQTILKRFIFGNYGSEYKASLIENNKFQ